MNLLAKLKSKFAISIREFTNLDAIDFRYFVAGGVGVDTCFIKFLRNITSIESVVYDAPIYGIMSSSEGDSDGGSDGGSGSSSGSSSSSSSSSPRAEPDDGNYSTLVRLNGSSDLGKRDIPAKYSNYAQEGRLSPTEANSPWHLNFLTAPGYQYGLGAEEKPNICMCTLSPMYPLSLVPSTIKSSYLTSYLLWGTITDYNFENYVYTDTPPLVIPKEKVRVYVLDTGANADHYVSKEAFPCIQY